MRMRTAAAVFSAVALTACTPSTETASSTTGSPTVAPPSTSAGAGPLRGPEPSVVTPLVASVIAAPIPVPATDGKVHLAYEVQVTNVLAQEVTLTSVTVLDRDVALLNLPADQLANWTRIVGNPTPTTKVGPAQSAVIWLDVALDKGIAVPERLTHTIGVSIPQPQPPLFPATMNVNVAPVTVQTRKPIVISPPLTGPSWVDADSCCELGAHRMALSPINGQLWGAERFAIDYAKLGPDGRGITGDKTKLESYPCFGADIYAVADGPVVTATDGLPEQAAGKNPTGLTLDQYPGNHIVQDLGGGNYAMYAHIMTGSVKVKPGDRLKAGQLIGSVGNTGNSSGPHLHFQVMSGPDPLAADGLPFVFNSFKLDSRLSPTDVEIDDGAPAVLQPGVTPRDETNVSPLSLDVMTYANR
jgi:hypothetical protein